MHPPPRSVRLAALAAAMLSSAAAATAMLSVAAAGGASGTAQVRAPEAVSFPRASVVLHGEGGGSVTVTVELAQTSRQRARGLMGRRSLPPRHGMLFLFPGPTRGGFWMKNTLIPLSIAFVGADGRIQQVMDMEPCRADPCRVYVPRRPYVRALEVNKGAFRRWGVKPGDRVVLRR